MNESKGNFYIRSFSHIYIEKEALTYPLAKRILERFPQAVHVEIDQYKEVFARSKQNFFVQKRAPKLILAVKKPPYLYPGAQVCHDFGHTHFYYTSSVLNCLYNCDYCFLQGMFPSANIVLFVNLEDTFSEITHMLRNHPVYLAITYETDLLAFENTAPFASQWIEFARGKKDLLIELRTKSANYPAIRHLAPTPNAILAWTLSPERVVKEFEAGTPSLQARLNNIRQAIDDGWQVRICFDPLLHIENWQEQYGDCVEQTFASIPGDKVTDISIGVFRIPKDYLKKMRKHRTSSILHYPYVCHQGVFSYPEEVAKQMTDFMVQRVQRFVPRESIFV